MISCLIDIHRSWSRSRSRCIFEGVGAGAENRAAPQLLKLFITTLQGGYREAKYFLSKITLPP